MVDTLFDMTLTREMLAQMTDATGLSGDDIDTVVNTHANGDHTHGNACCGEAEIIASAASAAEMEALPAAGLARLMERAERLDGGRRGEYLRLDIFRAFSTSLAWWSDCRPAPSPARSR